MSKILRDFITSKKHHTYRKEVTEINNMAEEFSALGLSPKERMTRRLEKMLELQEPVFLPDEKICFMRTATNIPDVFTKAEWEEIKSKHYIHELGYMSNLSPDYESVIAEGLIKKRETADEYGKRAIDAIISLADRYCALAEKEGKSELAAVLKRVPRYGATSFYEALQFFRIIHFSLWLEGNYHITVGRFDQYMYPYLKADMEKGLLSDDSALELLEDFFLSFNKDSDLYPGVQQGDNGQSMVLGGMDKEGNDAFNLLSELCLKASANLLLIDPKINLRVNKNTPLEVYEKGSELTKAGLGFPQYSNDDVVVDALVKLGYNLKDARDYVVAACWEFIIPKVGADVANIGALNFPKVIDTCLHRDLEKCSTFDEFKSAVKLEVKASVDAICTSFGNMWFVPSPFMNVMMDCEIYNGGRYNNFGIHGTGVATASDSLAAIEKYIYNEKKITAAELIEAVDNDFENNAELLHLLRFEAPKMGNDDDSSDSNAVMLLDTFGESLKGKTNCRGGIYRAGTGSAMYYLWHANEIGASPDGRRKGEPFGTNFSASLFAKINGPISVIKSFTKPHFENVINGGPLTLEFASSMFVGEESIKKLATFVKAFVDMGGHQMQLNAVNTEKLKEAQLHPELHQQLVVRIWGWSAYFVELDPEYQDHVLRRQQYSV